MEQPTKPTARCGRCARGSTLGPASVTSPWAWRAKASICNSRVTTSALARDVLHDWDGTLAHETEETFDEVVKKFVSSEHRTRGPIDRQAPFKGRALFIFDPDGNETEVNTRYLYGAPLR